MRRTGGFSLIEVLVAVAVVSLALPALLLNSIQQMDGTAYLRDKIIASWVASNALTEIQIAHSTRGELPSATLSGEEEMAGIDWRWEARIRKNRQFPELYPVEVQVWRRGAASPMAANQSYLYDSKALEQQLRDLKDKP